MKACIGLLRIVRYALVKGVGLGVEKVHIETYEEPFFKVRILLYGNLQDVVCCENSVPHVNKYR